MCEAIVNGMIDSGEVLSENVIVADISGQRLDYLKKSYGVQTVLSDGSGSAVSEIGGKCDVILLAVKPQQAVDVLSKLSEHVRADCIVISIMGGITIDFLKENLPKNKIMRVMPNTPMLVRKGVAGIAVSFDCDENDIQLCTSLFELMGTAYVIPEYLIDPLTSVSGCSPAFVYMFIEALSDGGVAKGLPREMAIKIASQAVAGAAEMVLQTDKHPAQLKDSVTSPGGGTIAGVHALENGGFRASVINAVTESCERMMEVGEKSQSK